MTKTQSHLLFLFSFVGIFIVYFIFLRTIDIVHIVLEEIYFILLLLFVFFIDVIYKKKMNGHKIIDFFKESTLSFKNIILFFILFQIIDYIYEDGFIGMISMWFSYWLFGYIAFFIMEIINYNKNLKIQIS